MTAGVTPAEKAGGRLYSLGGVIIAVALYSMIHIAARLLASSNLGEDDPLDAILTQTLSLGYLPDQLPLYDWVLWLVARVTGPGALHFQLLKYSVLTATCGFIFLSARKVMKGDAFWAFLSVEALALIYQISWRFHEGFTHAVGAMGAVAATFWLLLRLIERRRTIDYLLFGIAVGLGVLTVTTFWAYLAALLAAACLQPAMRRVLADPQIALAAALAGLIAAPYFTWLANTPEGISAILPTVMSNGPAEHLRLALGGIRRAFTEPVMYLAPLIFLYPLFFPGMVRHVRRQTRLRVDDANGPDFEQLILHHTLFCVALLIGAATVFGIERYPTHALMPLFLITSIWLTAQARNSMPSARLVRLFVIMAASVAVFAFFARAANMYLLQPVCNICRWGIPYAELAEQMKDAGFQSGTIIANDKEIGGNLHRFFPQARIVLVGGHNYAPPPPQSPGTADVKTALVWDAGLNEDRVAGEFRSLLPKLKASDLMNASTIRVPWKGNLWVPYGNPVSTWRVLILNRRLR